MFSRSFATATIIVSFILTSFQLILAHVPLASKTCPASAPVEKHGIFEVSFRYPTTGVANPWEDVQLQASMNTPSGKTYTLNGFYYEPDTYLLRFNPVELGTYTYTVTITGQAGKDIYEQNCSFKAVPASQANRYAQEGFVRQHPDQPHRFIFEEGKFFNGVGLNDCWDKNPPPRHPELGPLYGFTSSGNVTDIQTYMQTYAEGGFNLFRWDPGNCSFNVIQSMSPSGNEYLEYEGKLGDRLLATAKQNGFHVLLTFFSNVVPFPQLGNTNEEATLKRVIDYYVARYGPYVDMWEWFNENCWDFDNNPGCQPTNDWLAQYTDYLKSIDPYDRLVTNSYPRKNDYTFLDFRSPHRIVDDSFNLLKEYTNNFTTRTPVMIGEGYNANFDTHKNYGPNNAQITRRAAWTSVISGLGLIWWNSSFGVHCKCANQYLGSEERAYVGIEHQLTANIDPAAEFQLIRATPDSGNDGVKAYGVLSPKTIVIYVTKEIGFFKPVTPAITFTSTFKGTGHWIDPKTGAVLRTVQITEGLQTLTSPTITQDIVLTAGTAAAPFTKTPTSPLPDPPVKSRKNRPR